LPLIHNGLAVFFNFNFY